MSRFQKWVVGSALAFNFPMFGAVWYFTAMPGQSFAGPRPPLDAAGIALRDQLRHDVTFLAETIGERHMLKPRELQRAVQFIADTLRATGAPLAVQAVPAGPQNVVNVIAEWRGVERPAEIVVIGAHYDTIPGAPGANDNGSGTAALLALARGFQGAKPARTVRFVAFANEELPFQTEQMGSLFYARSCRTKGEKIVGMLSLETMAYFSEVPGSQHYPAVPLAWVYPDKGNFIGFVANPGSTALLRGVVAAFRTTGTVPSIGAALPPAIPGVAWSDHWAFWETGYPALMVTDTAPNRDPAYHTGDDTAARLDYDGLARVVIGLRPVVQGLGAGTIP